LRPSIDSIDQQRIVAVAHGSAGADAPQLKSGGPGGLHNASIGAAMRVGDRRRAVAGQRLDLVQSVGQGLGQLGIAHRLEIVVAKRVEADLESASVDAADLVA
jgi:hypothetical protein